MHPQGPVGAKQTFFSIPIQRLKHTVTLRSDTIHQDAHTIHEHTRIHEEIVTYEDTATTFAKMALQALASHGRALLPPIVGHGQKYLSHMYRQAINMSADLCHKICRADLEEGG